MQLPVAVAPAANFGFIETPYHNLYEISYLRYNEPTNFKTYQLRGTIMAWIKTINEHEATGPIAKIYEGTKRSWGGVDNIIKVHSLNHNVLRSLMLFYKSVMHGETDITLGQKEMIAVTVSALNECHY